MAKLEIYQSLWAMQPHSPDGVKVPVEEAFEMATWKQLKRHRRPIIVANIDGYWDPLLAIIDQTINQGFAEESSRGLWSTVDDVTKIVASAEALLADT